MPITRKTWKKRDRFFAGFFGYPHPIGYCGDQKCCWGKPGDKVLWPKRKS